MNDLQKELQDLKEKVDALEARIAAKTVKKWEPKGEKYLIMSNGKIVKASQTSINDTMAKLFGMKRQTQNQAERAGVEMRKFNRFLALRDELCGEIDESPYCLKYYVYFIKQQKMWRWAEGLSVMYITPHFTSEESAQKACDMLNSGEVEL